MKQLAMTEPWSSVGEITKHSEVAQTSIYKIGRLWKFKLSEVDVWVRTGGAEHREKATA